MGYWWLGLGSKINKTFSPDESHSFTALNQHSSTQHTNPTAQLSKTYLRTTSKMKFSVAIVSLASLAAAAPAPIEARVSFSLKSYRTPS